MEDEEPLDILAKYNPHPRDQMIEFEKLNHKYRIVVNGNNLEGVISVTEFYATHFPKYTSEELLSKMLLKKDTWKPDHRYYGMTAEQIKNQWDQISSDARNYGEKMHLKIETFMNNQNVKYPYTHKHLLDNYIETVKNKNGEVELILDKRGNGGSSLENHEKPTKNGLSFNYPKQNVVTQEWLYFLQYLRDFPNMKPYRTEWRVFHEELRLAGSIDMSYEALDSNEIVLMDWKRAKEIETDNKFKQFATTECIRNCPDTNLWHYAFQLNIYKMILESKYGKKVVRMFLLRLHPNAPSYELIEVIDLSKEVAALVQLRLSKFN